MTPSWIFYWRYPQATWASHVRGMLQRAGLTEGQAVVDAPCGDGIVSWWLEARLRSPMEAWDLDTPWLATARRRLRRTTVRTCDLRTVEVAAGDDAWVLVNSLYCLPDVEAIVARMRPRFRHVVGVFPRLDHRNHACFLRRNPGYATASPMDEDGTLRLFERQGYTLREKREVGAIAHHCVPDWMPRRLVTRLLGAVDPLVSLRGGRHPSWAARFERG